MIGNSPRGIVFDLLLQSQDLATEVEVLGQETGAIVLQASYLLRLI
jgi:hypothetical protein